MDGVNKLCICVAYRARGPRCVEPYSWPAELPESFKKVGFEDLMNYRHPISPDIRAFFTQMQFMVAEEFSYVAMDNSDPNAVGYERRRRIQEAAKQANERAAMHFNLEVTVGKKAS